VVTSPAVPPPTALTAAAFALSAAEPVTGFSAASSAAAPCPGNDPRACGAGAEPDWLAEPDGVDVVLGFVAAPAIADPPSASAPREPLRIRGDCRALPRAVRRVSRPGRAGARR
jgi:hypothetical protein